MCPPFIAVLLRVLSQLVALEPFTPNLSMHLNGWRCWLIALEPYTPNLGVQLIASQYWLIALQMENIHPHTFGVFFCAKHGDYKRDQSCETGW